MMEVRILINKDNEYQVEFRDKVRLNILVPVLHDLLTRLEEEVVPGQTAHPELTLEPIPGGDDDIFGGSD